MMEIRTDGPTQIVDDSMVGHLTQTGWRLVAIVSHEEAYTPGQEYGNHNGYPQQPQSHQAHAPFAIRKAKYVLTQSKDEAIRELSKKLAETNKVFNENIKKLNEATTSEKEVQKKLATSMAQVERLNARSGEHEATRKELEVTVRKMEADLGRVRQVLGSERFEQIVSPKDQPNADPTLGKDGRPQF